MGLGSVGAQVLYALRGLTMGDVVDICKRLAEVNGTDPTLDVDCNNVCFKLGKSIPLLTSFLVRWTKTGPCIVPICDDIL